MGNCLYYTREYSGREIIGLDGIYVSPNSISRINRLSEALMIIDNLKYNVIIISSSEEEANEIIKRVAVNVMNPHSVYKLEKPIISLVGEHDSLIEKLRREYGFLKIRKGRNYSDDIVDACI